jgi:hypothetical protein
MSAISGFAEIEGECWILHAPTIRAAARVGAQPLLEDALVHLQDFLEPREPRAHSLRYHLPFVLYVPVLCLTSQFPSAPSPLSSSEARVHLIFDYSSRFLLLFDGLLHL